MTTPKRWKLSFSAPLFPEKEYSRTVRFTLKTPFMDQPDEAILRIAQQIADDHKGWILESVDEI